MWGNINNMAISFSNIISRVFEDSFLKLSSICSSTQVRNRHLQALPKLRNPTWFTKKLRVESTELVTPENKQFIKEVVQDSYYNKLDVRKNIITNTQEVSNVQRTGVIARKIGIYPLWQKNGKKIITTLLQVLDNHVVRYYSPVEYDSPRKKTTGVIKKKGCLLVGAEAEDPSNFTKEYCGLFKESGVIPKKTIARFFVTPDAALPLGTLITAMHYQVGNIVDVRGKTIDHGFQGVMKRHGFKGMPASHGVTKTHRRGGNIGGGGEKGRVWPGTKMPGHMGNRYCVAKGLKILRINTKYNVLWVSGQAIPGETNSIVYIYDTILPLRTCDNVVPFPTYFPDSNESIAEDIFHNSIHNFSDPTVLYDEK